MGFEKEFVSIIILGVLFISCILAYQDVKSDLDHLSGWKKGFYGFSVLVIYTNGIMYFFKVIEKLSFGCSVFPCVGSLLPGIP